MATQLKTRSKLHIAEIDARDVHMHPDAIYDICSRKMAGMLIRNAVSEERISTILDRIDQGGASWRESMCAVQLIGMTLAEASPDLVGYFDEAARVRKTMRGLFGEEPDFEAQVRSILSSMSSGRPVSPVIAPNGSVYTGGVLRKLMPGHIGTGMHVDSLFFHRPGQDHLASLVHAEELLTYVLPLTMCNSGGDLVLYDLEWAELADELADISGRDISYISKRLKEAIPDCDKYESKQIDTNPGDLLLFNGGSIFHQVTPLNGTVPRCSFAGGIAFSKDREQVYMWH